jgi:transcriptional regulator with XRE-family HTH domain
MSNENIRLKIFRESLGMQQVDFARRIGLQPGSYCDIERGRNAVSLQVLKKAVDLFGLNPAWLLKGEGQMTDTEVLTQESVQDKGDNIIFVEQKAAAGYLQGLKQEGATLDKLPTFRLPGFYGQQYRAFEIKGNSMVPALFGKDIVVCSRVEDISALKYGPVYILILQDGSIVAKKIKKMQLAFTAISENEEEYPSYIIPREEIMEFWLVEARITGMMQASVPADERIEVLEKRIRKLEQLLGS